MSSPPSPSSLASPLLEDHNQQLPIHLRQHHNSSQSDDDSVTPGMLMMDSDDEEDDEEIDVQEEAEMTRPNIICGTTNNNMNLNNNKILPPLNTISVSAIAQGVGFGLNGINSDNISDKIGQSIIAGGLSNLQNNINNIKHSSMSPNSRITSSLQHQDHSPIHHQQQLFLDDQQDEHQLQQYPLSPSSSPSSPLSSNSPPICPQDGGNSLKGVIMKSVGPTNPHKNGGNRPLQKANLTSSMVGSLGVPIGIIPPVTTPLIPHAEGEQLYRPYVA